MSDQDSLTRRSLLAWSLAPMVGGLGCGSAVSAAAAVPTDTITVLYRRDSERGPARQEPAVQAGTLALEEEFAKRGFRVLQPDPQTYTMLDQGPSVAVSFAADAGFSMLFSATVSARPMPGMDKGLTEVILACRVFVGHSILVATEGKGMMAASMEAGVAEFAIRRSAELAAQKAAAMLADRVARRLKALTAADIERLTRLTLPTAPSFTVTAPAAPPASNLNASAPSAGLPAGALPVGRKFALIVGVSDYAVVRRRIGGSGPSDLKGVAHDRVALQSSLLELGFPQDHVKVLADGEATSGSVREHLGRLVAMTRPEDLVLLAFAAHGMAGSFVPSGFGLPVLSDYADRDPNLLDFWQLQSLIANLPARQAVLLIDTCHAGGATNMLQLTVSARGVDLRNGSGTADTGLVAQVHSQGNRSLAVLAASRPEEVALERPKGGGIFTSLLVEGLKAGKGRETLEQVFRDRVEQKVLEESRTRCKQIGQCQQQTPMFAFSGLGNLIRL